MLEHKNWYEVHINLISPQEEIPRAGYKMSAEA